MERLNTRHIVLTAATFVAIVYVVCAALILAAPSWTLAVANQWVHGVDLTAIAKAPAIGDVAVGFITSLIATGALAVLFAFLWNALLQKEVKR